MFGSFIQCVCWMFLVSGAMWFSTWCLLPPPFFYDKKGNPVTNFCNFSRSRGFNLALIAPILLWEESKLRNIFWDLVGFKRFAPKISCFFHGWCQMANNAAQTWYLGCSVQIFLTVCTARPMIGIKDLSPLPSSSFRHIFESQKTKTSDFKAFPPFPYYSAIFSVSNKHIPTHILFLSSHLLSNCVCFVRVGFFI